MLDCVLDLLLDGVTGIVPLTLPTGVSQAHVALGLAAIADCASDLVSGATGLVDDAAMWSQDWSYLPPLETMLERFYRDSRVASRDVRMGTDWDAMAAAE